MTMLQQLEVRCYPMSSWLTSLTIRYLKHSFSSTASWSIARRTTDKVSALWFNWKWQNTPDPLYIKSYAAWWWHRCNTWNFPHTFQLNKLSNTETGCKRLWERGVFPSHAHFLFLFLLLPLLATNFLPFLLATRNLCNSLPIPVYFIIPSHNILVLFSLQLHCLS